MQEGDKKQKNLGIITIKPNSNKTFVSAIENVEVEGGMKGGAQENHTNVHDRVTKGGSLPQVLHQGVNKEKKPDLRHTNSTNSQQQQLKHQQVQQPVQAKVNIQDNNGKSK